MTCHFAGNRRFSSASRKPLVSQISRAAPRRLSARVLQYMSPCDTGAVRTVSCFVRRSVNSQSKELVGGQSVAILYRLSVALVPQRRETFPQVFEHRKKSRSARVYNGEGCAVGRLRNLCAYLCVPDNSRRCGVWTDSIYIFIFIHRKGSKQT